MLMLDPASILMLEVSRGLLLRFQTGNAGEDALRLRAISFDAVKHLLLCRIEQRPPRLDLQNYPYLPMAQVATTAAADYLALLTPVQEGVL